MMLNHELTTSERNAIAALRAGTVEFADHIARMSNELSRWEGELAAGKIKPAAILSLAAVESERPFAADSLRLSRALRKYADAVDAYRLALVQAVGRIERETEA